MKREYFGTLPHGERVERLEMSNETLTVGVLTHGARLHSVHLAGIDRSLTVGSDDLNAYLGPMDFFGVICGPIVNRVTGAAVEIGGVRYRLPDPENRGLSLHCGPEGLHARVWELAELKPSELALTITLPDGACGLPGTRRIEARFSLEGPSLSLRLTAIVTARTPLNLANHSYWNFGPDAEISGHVLQVTADQVLETSSALLPTGRVLPVAGTHLDHRAPAPFRPGLGRRYDTSYCLSGTKRSPRPVAALQGGGVRMEMATTETSLQVYDAGTVEGRGLIGFDGRPLSAFCGVALEAQGWPDAPTHSGFPSILVLPEAPYRQETRWTFTRV